MRYWWFILILITIPAIHADTSGWYYAGDTFKLDDVIYSVEGGFAYDKVLLDVGGKSYLISLNDCVSTVFAKYCYTQTAYPNDDAHIKYQAGKQYYGYYLTINTVKPQVTTTRVLSSTSPKIGDQVQITVTLENKGDITVEDLTYVETIPEGLDLISGPNSDGKQITYVLKSLAPGKTDVFKYYVRPNDYVTKSLLPTFTYTFGGQKFNGTVAPLSFFVVTPLEITSTITPALNLDERGMYVLNITNKDTEYSMDVFVSLQLPEGLRDGLTDFEEGKNRTFTKKLTLKPKETTNLKLAFTGAVSGKFTIPVDVNISIGPAKFKRHYEEIVTAKSDKLVASIKTSSNRATYRPGDRLVFTGILENVNTVTTFKTISGTLRAPGLFPDQTFSHEAFPPQKVLNEAEGTAFMPTVDAPKTFVITLDGEYATPGGEVFTFSAEKSITVNPIKQIVDVTRTVTPAKPGQNITVTVSLKNIYGQYITYNTHEIYDPALVRASGVTYSEGSLDRDGSKDLYIYQLEIPANYNQSFNLTTEVLVKGEDPVKFTTNVLLVGMVAPPVLKPVEAVQNMTSSAEPEKKELGFFASIWDFLVHLI
jgi:uncharacterized repeat protein (TIGR01451 family)